MKATDRVQWGDPLVMEVFSAIERHGETGALLWSGRAYVTMRMVRAYQQAIRDWESMSAAEQKQALKGVGCP